MRPFFFARRWRPMAGDLPGECCGNRQVLRGRCAGHPWPDPLQSGTLSLSLRHTPTNPAPDLPVPAAPLSGTTGPLQPVR
jgi:hypothetical protein